MNGVHASGVGEKGIVLGLQENRHRSGLPVVALDHIGNKSQRDQCIQTCLGEVGEAFSIVRVAVSGALAAAEVIEIVDEVDLYAVGAVFQPVNTCVLLAPTQCHVELSRQLCFVGRIVHDLFIIGEQQYHFVAGDPGQCGGQRLHYITQTAGLDIGGAFRCQNGNFHTISPRLIIMGLEGVPISLAPGRTTTSLSRMTYFSSQFSPMIVSFIITQFSA